MTNEALVQYLADMDLRRLPTGALKSEAEYTLFLLAEVKRNDCEPGYKEYVIKRARVLKAELERRTRLLKWPARERASIPLDFLRSLKESAHIEEIFGRLLGLPCQPSGPNRMVYPCPAHPDRRPSGVVYLDQGRYHCYSCQAHGDIFDSLMAYRGSTFIEAVTLIAAYQGLDVPWSRRGVS